MADRFLRRGGSGEIVLKLCTKAILERELIAPGDRILIAASGGKDSTVMAWALASLRQVLKLDYETAAIHISSDFCSCCKKSILAEKLESWGIPFTDLFVPVIGRLKEGITLNIIHVCFMTGTGH
jgi:tRNA 2-thiocytidine biosynthesis protein TtcA